MDNAFRYIEANGGIDTETSYPYEAKNDKCRFNPNNVGATDTGKTGFSGQKSGNQKLKLAVFTVIFTFSVKAKYITNN